MIEIFIVYFHNRYLSWAFQGHLKVHWLYILHILTNKVLWHVYKFMNIEDGFDFIPVVKFNHQSRLHKLPIQGYFFMILHLCLIYTSDCICFLWQTIFLHLVLIQHSQVVYGNCNITFSLYFFQLTIEIVLLYSIHRIHQ